MGQPMQQGCTHQRKAPIRTWQRMRRLMEGKHLPLDYQQDMFRMYQECKQQSRTIDAYTEEFYRLSTHKDLVEFKY